MKEETALQKAFGAVKVTTTTAAAIKLIYTVLHYLIKHWPDINHFFHGLDTNSHINYWNMYPSGVTQKRPYRVTSKPAIEK